MRIEPTATPIDIEPLDERATSKTPIAVAAVLTVLSVGGFLGVAFLSSSSQPSAIEVTAEDAIAEDVRSAVPLATSAPTTTPSLARSASASSELDADEYAAVDEIIVDQPAVDDATVGEAAADALAVTSPVLAQSVVDTQKLTSVKVVSIQETGSLNGVFTITQVGDNARNRTEINGNVAEGLTVDGSVYELDGERWYLKPLAQRARDSVLSVDELLGGLAEVEGIEIARSESTITYELDCASIDDTSGGFASAVCASDLYVTATVDSETGLLATLFAEGAHETWPGVFQDGFTELSIQQVSDQDPITAPPVFDSSRYDCIAEELGASGPELSLLLNDLLTAENEALYTGCGFRFFPRGIDLDE